MTDGNKNCYTKIKTIMLKKYLILFTLCFIVFLDFLGYAIILPVLTLIFLDTKISFLPNHYDNETRTIIFALVSASYPIAQLFGAPIIGALSDRFGRKKMLILTIFGTIIGNLSFVFGFSLANIYILILGRLLSGFMGGNAALANSIVGDISDNTEKVRNYGFIGLAMGLGIVLGPFIGGRLTNQELNLPFDLKIQTTVLTPFYAATALSIFAMLSVILILQETLNQAIYRKIKPFNGIKDLYQSFRKIELRVVYIMTLLIALGFNMFVYNLNIYLFHKFNFNSTQLGDFFAFSGLCLVITLGVINPFISKKFKSKYVLSTSLLGMAITIILSTLPQRVLTMYAVMPFLALFYGLSQANMAALLSNTAGHKIQGQAFGINQAIQSFVEGITPITTALLLVFDIFVPTILAASATFFCWIIFMIYFFRKQSLTQTSTN